MTKPVRPEGVPEEATFHDEWKEWVLGERRGEACVGEWRQWHGTAGHLTCIDIYDDDGALTHVTRFHPDGTVSQKVPHHDGKPHGTAVYQRSKHESEERSMETAPAAAFRMELYWQHGKQPTPARFFDEGGAEISAEGKPKPAGLPEQARSDGEGRWVLNQAALQDAYDGVETAWRSDGTKLFEQHRDGDRLVLVRQFHPDGTPAQERDYRAEKGWFRHAKGESDIEAPEMPGDAHEVRYAIQVVNPKTGLYWPRDQVFLDAQGNELSDRGLTIRKPHVDAHLVKEKTWYQPKIYWCHRDGEVTSYWRQEGSLVMRTRHEGEHLVGFTQYDDEGRPIIEETFFPRTEDDRPVNRALTVHIEGGRIEIACNEDGTCRTFTRYEGDTVTESVDNADLDALEIGAFDAEFFRRFERLQAVSGVELWFDFFTISAIGAETFDEFFQAAVLGGDGAGNEIVAILEGEHAGEVYFLDHEEDLYALECVDEYIDEEGLEADSMSKDELIEAMPFMENQLAPSLAAFVRGVRVNAHATYYRSLKDFHRVE